jgi:serine/threonine protein kinase
MERLVGSDLQKFLGRYGALSREETVWILGQVAKALQRAHQIGLVHRDLKPENLFLHLRPDAPPIIKILDFGLVHLMRSPEAATTGAADEPDDEPRPAVEHIGDARMTRAGTIIGTPMYMAPELVEGAVDRTGPATDIWAIGLIAFELLTGISFWIPAPVPLLLGRILDGPMPSPAQRSHKIPPGFVPWFARSCARDANGRWQSVNEQIEALAEALHVPVSLLSQADPPPSLLNRIDELMASLSSAGMTAGELPSRAPPSRPPGKTATLTKTAIIARRLRQLGNERRMNMLLISATITAVLLWAIVFSLRACQVRSTAAPPSLPADPPTSTEPIAAPSSGRTSTPVSPVGAATPPPTPTPQPPTQPGQLPRHLGEVKDRDKDKDRDRDKDPPTERRRRPKPAAPESEPTRPVVKRPSGPYIPVAP